MMTDYSMGFCFSEDGTDILLMKRTKDDWQKGHFNGIGGHREIGESFHQCMVREFEEEAGLSLSRWKYTYTLEIKNVAEIAMFRIFTDEIYKLRVPVILDEGIINIHAVADLPHPLLSNMEWQIPLHADRRLFNTDFIVDCNEANR